MMRALDLFSAAAGGWSLGLHRAGFVTVAACEIVEWRRILYAENNPHVRLYEDVRALTATRLVSDLGILPDIIVGSPPCQDISSANTKGKGIDGERSGLYLEAVRLVGDCRPRWFAFENSPNLRTRGADRLLDELETLGYACEPCVVAAADIGANHVRKRSWLIGYDPRQLADASIQRCGARAGNDQGSREQKDRHEPAHGFPSRSTGPDAADPHQKGQPHGRLESSLRKAEIADDGRGDERGDDGLDADSDRESTGPVIHPEMGGSADAGDAVAEPWADWNGGLAHHLRLDDGLSPWVADTRIALGSRKGTSAAGLIVEAFGDAVLPQIPEVIGRAILRTEAALDVVLARSPQHIAGDEQ
ncbi:DNA cytosine methyltransferase [Rhizorhapis sp. SPR117]|uniref:DNA cytosine methyltransferase n=1 Tax=Rhizorhapis sp. SPR117 TaxID=2912611 RepID=UPI001F02D223|nr:DNA cytosine methyltransferase [Rhizorhapis sp. SPR117]